MSSIDLLKVTQTFYLHIFNYAVLIENQYGDFLQPPKPGIYKLGDVFPSIEPNKVYYAQKVNKDQSCTTMPITDINKVTDRIIDEIGNVVIPANMMRNKEHYLSNAPTVPVRGLLIVELLIKKYIESIAPYIKHSMQNSRIAAQIKPDNYAIFHDGCLEKICESLFLQVSDFIGNDVWHIYFVKLINQDLIIEKSIDFRVHQWTLEHGHEY